MPDPQLTDDPGVDMHAYPCCPHCTHRACKCTDVDGNPKPCDFEGHPLPCRWCARYGGYGGAQRAEPVLDVDQIVTKTGRVLTENDIQALANEAERGYDLEA